MRGMLNSSYQEDKATLKKGSFFYLKNKLYFTLAEEIV